MINTSQYKNHLPLTQVFLEKKRIMIILINFRQPVKIFKRKPSGQLLFNRKSMINRARVLQQGFDTITFYH